MSKQRNLPGFKETAQAFAGFTGALAVIAKFAAWVFAPTGLAALAIAIGLQSPPAFVVAAGLLAALAAVFSILYGVALFWSWLCLLFRRQ